MDLTRILAEYAAQMEFSALPKEVIEQTKLVMLDTMGCGIAGYTISYEEILPIIKLAKSQGGQGASTILCDSHNTTASYAAFANGGIIHSIDFDDTHSACFAHFGASLLPTVIALGQQLKANGKDVIDAFATGYEIGARIGRTVFPSHYDFWHPTATLGNIAAAVAAAKLLKFDAVEMEQAISLAADEAAGLRYCIDKGDFSKSLHPALSAMKGIIVSLLIADGAIGPRGLLEYPSGFCNAYSREPNQEKALAGLGEYYEVMNDIIKVSPTINCSQAPIQAALSLIHEHDIRAQDVDKVHLTRMFRYAGKEQGLNYAPDTLLAAHLSIPFCIALAFHKRAVTTREFNEENLHDRNILQFMQKLTVTMDEDLNKRYPGETAAIILNIQTKNRKEYQTSMRFPKGHPNNRLSLQEVKDKFIGLASYTLQSEQISQLYETMLNLEKIKDIGLMIMPCVCRESSHA